MWQAVAAQPFNTTMRHKAPRAVDGSVNEFWLENPFDFERLKGFNLSMYERNRLYLNQGGNHFAEASFVSGVDIDSDTRAVAVGDFDEDGRPDLVVRNVGGGPLRLFLNATEAGASVTVRLQGTRSNRQGTGAQMWLEADGRTQYREHYPQNSLLTQWAHETIFGVGDAKGPFKLRIRWPSGTEQTIELPPGRHTVTEPGS